MGWHRVRPCTYQVLILVESKRAVHAFLIQMVQKLVWFLPMNVHAVQKNTCLVAIQITKDVTKRIITMMVKEVDVKVFHLMEDGLFQLLEPLAISISLIILALYALQGHINVVIMPTLHMNISK